MPSIYWDFKFITLKLLIDGVDGKVMLIDVGLLAVFNASSNFTDSSLIVNSGDGRQIP